MLKYIGNQTYIEPTLSAGQVNRKTGYFLLIL